MQNPDEPFCGSCGYSLKGLTESSKCPECGKPIVEVLVRDSFPGRSGRRYQSARRMWGLPLISIAIGPHGSEKIGRPVGIIAIGDHPRGIVAIGACSLGVIAIGGVSAGGVTIGGVSLGLLAGWGGLATGFFAAGGLAVGAYAYGGQAVAFIKGVGGAVYYIRPWW